MTTATFESRIARWPHSVQDGSLEDGFARRDAIAYEMAYRAFGGRMQATALRILRDNEAARECVQEVFERLWRRGGAYSPARGSLEAFLVTCSRNAALTNLRSSHRREETTQKMEPPGEFSLEEDPIERESSRPDAAVLCYGFILFDVPKPEREEQFLGPNATEEQKKMLSPRLNVRTDTPHTFIWQTVEDDKVAVFGRFTYTSTKLRKTVTTPFAIFCKVHDGKVAYMQFMEDTFATSASFR